MKCKTTACVYNYYGKCLQEKDPNDCYEPEYNSFFQNDDEEGEC